MLRVLVLCADNSARSQIAEGLLRAAVPPSVEVYRAGLHSGNISAEAIVVMREIGLDISDQWATRLHELRATHFDVVITLADTVRDSCPPLPGHPIPLHWPVADPTKVVGDGRLPAFRRTRDQLRTDVTAFARSWHAHEIGPVTPHPVTSSIEGS